MVSPSFFSHLAKVPSVMVGDKAGSNTSTAMIVSPNGTSEFTVFGSIFVNAIHCILSTALIILSVFGSAISSKLAAYGSGTSFEVTRITGASR